MPDCKVFYSPLSQRDLDEIYDYIAVELANPISAAEIVTEILDAVDDLALFPAIGGIVRNVPLLTCEYRFLPVRNYIVFYRRTDNNVFVDRILYKKRDYARLLGLQ